MKSKNKRDRRNRIGGHGSFRLTAASDPRLNADRGSPRRDRLCMNLGILSQILLGLMAVGGTSTGIVEAFPETTFSNRRLPFAIAVRNGQRKQPWQGTRDEIENSLWPGFDRRKTKGSSATWLHLFFNKRDEDGLIIKKGKKRRPTTETQNELRMPGISFPKEVKLDGSNANDVSLLLRYMTTDDLKTLVPMCVEEFGADFQQQQLSGSVNSNNRRRNLLPRWILDPKQILNAYEGYSFEMLIYWTLRLKLMQGGNSRHPSSIIPNDPVMLVLCEQRDTETLLYSPIKNENPVIGMVELSLQPPEADRNPPALPLPLWLKAALAKRTIDGSLQGWVTNLLVSDSCRGRGYSKILMATAEGIAQHKWGCTSVYLHADADSRSGKIPQSLYEGLGYDLVIGSTKKSGKKGGKADENLGAKFAWAGLSSGNQLERLTAIRMVDGVPLLCYSKQL